MKPSVLKPPYPSGSCFPILERLDSDAHGIDVHVSFYRKDTADAAWVIRQMAGEIAMLRRALGLA